MVCVSRVCDISMGRVCGIRLKLQGCGLEGGWGGGRVNSLLLLGGVLLTCASQMCVFKELLF